MNPDSARAPRHEPLIVLVGGSSGTGKTVLAQRLAAHFAMPSALADDFRLFGQRITTASQLPALHVFVRAAPDARRAPLTAEEARDGLIAIADLVSRGLEIVIAHHLSIQSPLLIEGDSISAALASSSEFGGIPAGGRVQSLFLHEPDESRVLANMLARGRGIERLSAAEQARGARAAWLHGEALAGEARRLGLPVITSSPFESLFERAQRAL
jgi:2-phosphoglycerate kinase